MTISIVSGKGGTGKTTFAVNLAWALGNRNARTPSGERREIRLLDCDVEEPNAHLFVRPKTTTRDSVTVPKPVWDPDTCIACGKCASACQFNAIALVKRQVLIFNDLCHSCGACAHVCPAKAITESPVQIGQVEYAPGHEPFFFAQGILKVGETLSPVVVDSVKRHIKPEAINILDAAPGTACPVVRAMDGADAALLVTESTPFGLHDLKLAAGLTMKLRVPAAIVINRSDGVDALIADYASSVGIPIAGRIPFRREYAEAYSSGTILAERFPEFRDNVLDIFDNLVTACPPLAEEERICVDTGAGREVFPRGSATHHREIAVISGKGGTGKTTIAASLIRLNADLVVADNDVDASNLHLLLNPVVLECHDFVGGFDYTIDGKACTSCGLCKKLCRFGAIDGAVGSDDNSNSPFRIEEHLCEGCGLCMSICPVGAISRKGKIGGVWYLSATRHDPMLHARLGIAAENSGKLVTTVRQAASKQAAELGRGMIIADGPPGTGCPVIASVTGTDLVLLVVEPTVSGVHDLERALTLVGHFGMPAVIAINKYDLNATQVSRIEALAQKHNAPIAGRIPFDMAVHAAALQGKIVVDCGDGPAKTALLELNDALADILRTTP